MSAAAQMAAMLDELMGPKRNLDLGTDISVSYDDPDICKHYLVAFCPHDMFTNTKADLGACPKVHDDKLKAGYPTSSAFEKMGFEQDFLRFLIKLEDDNQRRIRRNKDKLRANDEYGQKKDEERMAKYKAELEQIEEDIKKVIKAAEEAGNRGDVSTTMELVSQSEVLEASRVSIVAKMEEQVPPIVAALAPLLTDAENRQKDVCETCGSMLIRNDAQCRVEEHLSGKMHTGFTKIQVTIKEFKEKFAKREEEMEKERQERRKEREANREKGGESGSSGKDREKERDRRSDRDRGSGRDRDRDRDHRRRDRSRDRRDRSRDRSRRDDRDRRSRR